MTRKTVVELCTLLIVAGCAEQAEHARAGHDESRTAAAAHVVTSSAGTVTGPVRGSYNGKPFIAVVSVTRFLAQDGVPHAVGTLESVMGDLPDATVDALQDQTYHFPVVIGPTVRPQVVIESDAAPTALDAGSLGSTCEVLYVRLAPLHLDVLGLVLDLDTVTLDIHAEQAAGNLLGNLLCTVAGLLDPMSTLGGPTPANLQRAVELLNQLVTVDRDAAVGDGGPERRATDAGTNPETPVDGSIRF